MMRAIALSLLGLLIIQAMKHAADQQLLEDKIQFLESIQCPKVPTCEPKIIKVEAKCPAYEACPTCERCPSYWELCD